uniref:Putative gibberellin 2-beta-dioxygenase 8 n=1 Tax=Ambrosia artemisiifolia TaxID=4212 RepID=A0A4P8PIP1_AMBAR|nr:putative gibberellin 2-beta-dioxygenase 8 [Ambrosia artemisiifolia]
MQQFSPSYPPCFRHQFSDQTPNQLSNNDKNNHEQQDPLPSIDLQQINLKQLESACTDWGIFRLVNHGIPSGLLSELHEHAVKIFELEFESKQRLFESVSSSVMSYFWGTPALTPAGVALRKDEGTVDYNWVEGLNIPLSQPSQVDLVHQPLIRDFRRLLESYGVHLERLAKSIFGAMSQNLKLSEDNECYLSPSTGQLRVYRYPRCCFDNPPKVWGMDVHTDSSVVTILNQFEVGGLQILSPKDNAWIDAKPIPNTLIVHLGDMMQAISNDKYKSVKHRVLVNSEKERFSIGYFVFPGDDCVIQSPNYKPFTYPDFRAQVQQDVKTLGLKVGLSRFKLTDNVDS